MEALLMIWVIVIMVAGITYFEMNSGWHEDDE